MLHRTQSGIMELALKIPIIQKFTYQSDFAKAVQPGRNDLDIVIKGRSPPRGESKRLIVEFV